MHREKKVASLISSQLGDLRSEVTREVGDVKLRCRVGWSPLEGTVPRCATLVFIYTGDGVRAQACACLSLLAQTHGTQPSFGIMVLEVRIVARAAVDCISSALPACRHLDSLPGTVGCGSGMPTALSDGCVPCASLPTRRVFPAHCALVPAPFQCMIVRPSLPQVFLSPLLKLCAMPHKVMSDHGNMAVSLRPNAPGGLRGSYNLPQGCMALRPSALAPAVRHA